MKKFDMIADTAVRVLRATCVAIAIIALFLMWAIRTASGLDLIAIAIIVLFLTWAIRHASGREIIAIAVIVLFLMWAIRPGFGQEIFADGFESGDAREWSRVQNEIEADFCVMLEWHSDRQQMMQVEFRIVGEEQIRDGMVACPDNDCHGQFFTCWEGQLSHSTFNRELLVSGSYEWLTYRSR